MINKKLKEYFGKKTLIVLVEKKTKCKISYQTLWTWEKNGLIEPVGFYMNGAQRRPIYDDSTLANLVEKVKEAQKAGNFKVNIK